MNDFVYMWEAEPWFDKPQLRRFSKSVIATTERHIFESWEEARDWMVKDAKDKIKRCREISANYKLRIKQLKSLPEEK